MVSLGRVQTPGSFFSLEWGCATFLACTCVHHPRSSRNLICGGFLWGLHHDRHDQLIPQFLAPLFLKKKKKKLGSGAYSKLLIMMKLKGTCSLEEKLWKLSQHIREQRHHFANKGPCSQSYGFSSNHVWMWELDHKESWAPKNWCFRIAVLEKTLKSPLDSKEIKPLSPEGNQP